MKNSLRLFFALGALSLVSAGVARADDVGEAKQHIAARQSDVTSLKQSGAIGENNRGFLESRGGGGNSAAVVADENRDRGVLYAEAAKRTGASVDEVGKARAKQIASNSAAGLWLQREDGSWYKK